MFLKAGVLSLALLLASRLLGLARESAQAAAFGASGLADVVVLMLTLPDWLTGVLASGALSYVLVPAWSPMSRPQVQATQRRVAWALLALGGVIAIALVTLRVSAVRWLAGGIAPAMQPAASAALVWSALAIPAALLASLWATRLQHERDFTGMYAANLVVNVVLVAAIVVSATRGRVDVLTWLGTGLLAAMLARLAWLRWRMPVDAEPPSAQHPASHGLPASSVWMWAVLSAGLPLALPFAARSMASQGGEGALAVFNYAWKLVELPLILAIQLVATLAFPAIAKALSANDAAALRSAVRRSIALGWTLAAAAAAALLVAAPSIAQLLFGWGRMDAASLARVAAWGAIAAWGLLPQSLIAVAVTVLAAQRRLGAAALAYLGGLALLLASSLWGAPDGAMLMLLLDVIFAGIALALLRALGSQVREWMPWRSMVLPLLCVLAAAAAAHASTWDWGRWWGLFIAVLVAMAVIALAWWRSADLREALAR